MIPKYTSAFVLYTLIHSAVNSKLKERHRRNSGDESWPLHHLKIVFVSAKTLHMNTQQRLKTKANGVRGGTSPYHQVAVVWNIAYNQEDVCSKNRKCTGEEVKVIGWKTWIPQRQAQEICGGTNICVSGP